MRRYMMLDHYSRTGQWQKIEADCQGKITNFLYMNILARALAEQGKLADTMFDYQFRHRGFWQCMDTLRDKEKLEKLWAANKAPWKRWED